MICSPTDPGLGERMHTETEYMLTVTESATWDGSGDASKPSYIMISLVEREPQDPIDEDAPEPDPLFIQHASDVLTLLGHEIFTGDRVVRVEVAHTAQIDGKWPVVCATSREFEACIAHLRQYENTAHHKELYPVYLWVFQQQNARAAMRVIDASVLLPEDEALAQEVLGTVELSVEMYPSFLDVLTIPFRRDQALQWVKGAVMRCGLEVEWRVQNDATG